MYTMNPVLFPKGKKRETMKQDEKNEEELQAEEIAHLADRALIFLSFKDAPVQNLSFVLKTLGIQTYEEKSKILTEIYRLIREGIVYIPDSGLPELIRNRLSDPVEVDKIDLRLLQPYDKIIQEIQRQIKVMREKYEEEE